MDDITIDALREVLQDMTMAIELISSGERSGQALINFIEEMLKTIEAWAAKYNVVIDDGIMAMESAQTFRPNTSLSSYIHYPVISKDHLGQDTVNQSREHNQIAGEAHHQSVESLNEDGDGNNEKGGESVLHSQNDETQRDDRQDGSSKAKASRRVSRKTRSQVTTTSVDGGPIHVDGTLRDDREAKVDSNEPLIGSPNLVGEIPSGDAMPPSQASERKGDAVKSPDWLPKGWITEMKARGTGGSGGSRDKFYFDPISKRRFRSKKEVLDFLGTTKRKRGRPRKSDSKDESPGHTNDTTQDESNQDSTRSLNPDTFSSNTATPATTSTMATSIEAGVADVAVPTLDTTKRKRGRPRKSDSVKNVSQTKDESPGHASASAHAGSIPESVKVSTMELQVPSNRSCSNTNMPPPGTASCSNTNMPPGHASASAHAGSIPESVKVSTMELQVPSNRSCSNINMPPPGTASSSTAAPSGPMDSCMPMPHQSGQPSEWLVYESLASLPFPMFEHLRLVESNANKLANNNSPSTLWPWMLGNAEGLKKAFGDAKPDESKPVEGSKQGQNAPISTGETQTPEVVPKRPKKAARKNAS